MAQNEGEKDTQKKKQKKENFLNFSGNESTMNLNPLILANVQGSSYFKVHLFKHKTYHEVVDEIYYTVKHLEPWERGSRKTGGQTGMCGGVRGVGAGGIVSSAFCLLYKLYTLKLTRKQLNGLINHTDSPYIRGLGFMYLRYTQPPGDLFDWYEDYLQDEEEIDVKAGGGQMMTIGSMLRQWLIKLDWFSTLFPRIPVPIQKSIEQKLGEYDRQNNIQAAPSFNAGPARYAGGASNSSSDRRERPPKDNYYSREPVRRPTTKDRSRSRSRERSPKVSRKEYRSESDKDRRRKDYDHDHKSKYSSYEGRSRDQPKERKRDYDDRSSRKRY